MLKSTLPFLLLCFGIPIAVQAEPPAPVPLTPESPETVGQVSPVPLVRYGEVVVTVQATADNAPVSGATITLTRVGGGPKIPVRESGSTGAIRFGALEPGDYDVVVKAPNFLEDRTRIHVDPGKRVTYSSFIDRPGQERVVRVTANQVAVEDIDPTQNAQVKRSSTFVNTGIADSRSMQAILNTSAGMQSDANGQVHVRGEHKSLSYELDGLEVPNGLSNNYSSLFDPRFVDDLSIKLGNYDASQFGQLGAVLSISNDVGKITPYIKLEDGVGDHGFLEEVLKAEGSNQAGTFDYMVGVHEEGTALRTEPPSPTYQSFHNTGTDTNIEVSLKAKPGKDDKLALLLLHQNDSLGVPNDVVSQMAGVQQNIYDHNDLAMLAWDHRFDAQDAMKLGLTYFGSGERYTNNGKFTEFTVVPASVSQYLNANNEPLNAENPGTPYLPTSKLDIQQFQQQIELSHNFSDKSFIKVGANADFIWSGQSVYVLDAGGGGGLPNPTGAAVAPSVFNTTVNRSGFFGGVYFSQTLPLSDSVTLNYGVRAERFDNGLGLDTGQISPRVNFLWKPNDTSAFRVSYNSLFQPPPLEIDVSGLTTALPQKVDQYEISYELQPAHEVSLEIGYVYKSFKNQLDVGLLIPNSSVPIFAPLNFDRAYYDGVELTASTHHAHGLNEFLSATYGVAKPTEGSLYEGSVPPAYNDHDQRLQVTGGVSESWGHGWSGEGDFLFGTGYPQPTLAAYNAAGIYPFGLDPNGGRIPHFYLNGSIGFTPTDADGKEKNGVGFKLQVLNVLDSRPDLNFLSGFSGTRFSLGRRIVLNTSYRF